MPNHNSIPPMPENFSTDELLGGVPLRRHLLKTPAPKPLPTQRQQEADKLLTQIFSALEMAFKALGSNDITAASYTLGVCRGFISQYCDRYEVPYE